VIHTKGKKQCSQQIAEKIKEPKVDHEIQYMADAVSGFAALYDKSKQLMREQTQTFEASCVQVAIEVAKINAEAQNRAIEARIQADEGCKNEEKNLMKGCKNEGKNLKKGCKQDVKIFRTK
jgi:hypothetical protein